MCVCLCAGEDITLQEDSVAACPGHGSDELDELMLTSLLMTRAYGEEFRAFHD